MTDKETDLSTYCAICKQRTKYASMHTNIYDVCGKEEKWPSDKRFMGDFYQVSVSSNSYANHRRYSFCSSEHMFQFIIKYKKSFDYMNLPMVNDGRKREQGYKNNLKQSDIKRMFKIKKVKKK